MTIKEQFLSLGMSPVKALIPREGIPLSTWSVIACDQYTSSGTYWKNVESTVGNAPSTRRLIFPEYYLEAPDRKARIKAIAAAMEDYLEHGILRETPEGFIVLCRTFPDGRSRLGLLCALDLEQYDYHPDAQTLIRCTEGTIESRIPPRLAIRKDAPLELPHIMVLIDDPAKSVIEPLWQRVQPQHPLYAGDLGFQMGSICGYHIPVDDSQDILSALKALYASIPGEHPMLFAMGDGNHSFATAKAHWEQVKSTLTPEEQLCHPARFAMCEIVNLHDDGLGFEAIHRVLFTRDENALSFILSHMESQGCVIAPVKPGAEGAMGYQAGDRSGAVSITPPGDALLLSMLDGAIAAYLSSHPDASVDYIHGEEETRAFAKDGVGFLLPAMEKSQLFPYVQNHGPLPRKTFSLGEADEKRCYLEARRITMTKVDPAE